jgi:hypothetical protein
MQKLPLYLCKNNYLNIIDVYSNNNFVYTFCGYPDISPKAVSPKDISSKPFRRRDTLPKGHFVEWNISPKGCFTEWTFHRSPFRQSHFAECPFRRMDTLPKIK